MKRIAIGVILAVLAVAVGAGVWLRFANPDLTETQLFLTFWPVSLAVTLLVILALAVDILWKGK